MEIGAEGGEAIVVRRIREDAGRNISDVRLPKDKSGGALGLDPNSRNRAEAELTGFHLLESREIMKPAQIREFRSGTL
jgi:hypothetical protein